MRTVRYAYVAVKTQIPGRAWRVPAVCAGPADSGQRLVRSSGRLGGDPVRTPNGLRSPLWLPSVRSLTEAEPEARRHPAARDMGDRVRPRSTRPSAALAGTWAAALLTPGPRRRWPPNAVDHRRPALRPRIGRGPRLDIQAATAALNLRTTRLARRGQHQDPDDQAENAGPRQLRPPELRILLV